MRGAGADLTPEDSVERRAVGFLSDEPVQDPAQDSFGHLDYAVVLREIVTDESPPQTIGLMGSWGVGKSTILKGLEAQLDSETAYAYFDAWKYEEGSAPS